MAPSPAAQPAVSAPVEPSLEHGVGTGSEAIATAPGKIASGHREKNEAIVFQGGGAGGANAGLDAGLKFKIGTPRNGELVLIWLLVGSSTPSLFPAPGYKQLRPLWTFNVGNTAAAIFYHFWKTGDPTSLAFGVGSNSAHCDWAYAFYSGVNTSTPFDGMPTEATSHLSNTGRSPSITPGAGNNADMLLMLYGQAIAAGGYASSPSLGKIREQFSYAHVAVWVDSALSKSSATGTQTIRSDVKGNWIGVQALLLPQSRGRFAGEEGGDRD